MIKHGYEEVFIVDSLGGAYGYKPDDIDEMGNRLVRNLLIILNEKVKMEKREIDKSKRGRR